MELKYSLVFLCAFGIAVKIGQGILLETQQNGAIDDMVNIATLSALTILRRVITTTAQRLKLYTFGEYKRENS